MDGNLDPHPGRTIDRIMREHKVELLAVSVMPGPQMVAAIPICREFRAKYMSVPIVWGGYFPSLYTDATLNANYVDFVVNGQGEETFPRTARGAARGSQVRGHFAGSRTKTSSDCMCTMRCARCARRTIFPPAVSQAGRLWKSICCRRFWGAAPRSIMRASAARSAASSAAWCRFSTAARRWKLLSARPRCSARLQRDYGIDAVQFYDNNFFLNESHAVDQAERLIPLKLRWWAEGRIDAMLRYSDDTLRRFAKAGATMIFFGAESGSDATLLAMNKKITTEQTLELAERIRRVRHHSGVFFRCRQSGGPGARHARNHRFIRRIKRLNPDAEIIVQHYIPTPHPDGMYGKVDSAMQFPETPDEWASERWFNFTIRKDPRLPWLPRAVKRRIDNFELVINSRWPTVQDIHLPRWSRLMLRSLSSWRYAAGFYAAPFELAWAQKLVALRKPRLESL